jgi:hypothetical protein
MKCNYNTSLVVLIYEAYKFALLQNIIIKRSHFATPSQKYELLLSVAFKLDPVGKYENFQKRNLSKYYFKMQSFLSEKNIVLIKGQCTMRK